MKSPLRWAGGKAWFLPTFNYLTRNTQYQTLVELFAGGASIAFGRREKNAVLNDLNYSLTEFYRAIQAGWFPQEPDYVTLDQYLKLRDEFNAQKTLHPESGNYNHARHAELFYFLNKFGFNGLYRETKKGRFNVPWNQKNWISYPHFSVYQKLMAGWVITTNDYSRVVVGDGDLVFADPPYDSTFSSYTSEGFGWNDQLLLARHLNKLATEGLPVITTNASTGRMRELYTDYGFKVIQTEAPRRISADGDRTPAMEMIAYRNLGSDKVP